MVETADGGQTWVYDDQVLPNVGFNAVVGRPVSEYGFEPVRFDEMRRGAWDIDERVKDMDLNGVYASLNFPSFLPGFAGQRLQQVTNDRDLALASVRAWNDWHHRRVGRFAPRRIIPCQLPWLLDPELGAEMIRENAERGFHAVTFSENPAMLGLPSIHSGHWDPMMAACAETGTVVNLHIGSSGSSPSTTDDAPPDVRACCSSPTPSRRRSTGCTPDCTRFPDLKICLSEGGIGWVAGLFDRLDHMLSYHDMYGTWEALGESLTRRRCSTATSGSARWRTSLLSCSTNGSVPTTSCSRPTTRTVTRRGRTPRRRCTNKSAACPELIRSSPGRTLLGCTSIQCLPRFSGIQSRSDRFC